MTSLFRIKLIVPHSKKDRNYFWPPLYTFILKKNSPMKKWWLLIVFSTAMSVITAQEIGIIMGTARQYMQDGVEQTLIKLKAMGIRHLEGAGARGMTREAYKKLLDQYGFDVVASGVSFDRLMYPDSVKMLIENLKFFGAEYAVCYWIPHPGDDFGMTEMDKAVNVFNKAGQQFAEAGISFVYHPHGYEFRAYNGPGTLFDYMLTKTDPRYVNFQMDVFWIRNPGQNPAALMRKYPGRFPLTHLKDRMHGSVDNQNGRQDPQRNVVLGDGDVNIAEVMKAAKIGGVKYHLIEDESARAMVQLPQHLRYLRSLELETMAMEISVNALHKAMLTADSLTLRNLTAVELTYGHSGGQLEDQDLFVENIASKKVIYKTWTVTDQTVTVKGDVAWVRHNVHGELTSNGAPLTLDLKVLQVWTKVHGIWKLLARQTVRV